MGLTINTNSQSLFAQRALGGNTSNLQKSIERLSTGFKINRAADDAAGLSISEKMTASVNGLNKASQNAQDGISLIQTAEGGLGVIQDNLQRVRELVVQASNGTNSAAERDAIQREINERVTTIEDIGDATEFNGISLLGGGADITLQTGAENGQTTTLALNASGAGVGVKIDIDAAADNGGLGEGTIALAKLRVAGAAVTSQDGTNADAGGIGDLDTMIGNVSRMRSYLGAAQNGLNSKIQYLDTASENLSSARSRIKDVDVAAESSNFVKSQILQQASAGMLSQANGSSQIALNLLP